jgi:GT2 family glycosyltransferase
MEKTPTRIAVLLTAHNRKEKTLKCITNLYTAINYLDAEVSFDIYLTDDGSSDGTWEAIEFDFPAVNLIKGDGLYLFLEYLTFCLIGF